jgi:AcrR family transcriptional regulator
VSQTAARRQDRISRDFARRCAAIREVARDLLARDGIASFTMERVADEAGYARTAIYRFFPSKRELLIGLAIESLELRLELYDRVAELDARPRERLVAFGEATCLLYPRHVLPQVFGAAKSRRARRSDQGLDRLRTLQRRDERMVAMVAKEAIDSGDLVLAPAATLEETVFAVHALTQGIFERFGLGPKPVGISDPRIVLRRAGAQLLDGLGWRPLSNEWDYRATVSRIHREVFTPRFLAARRLLAHPDGMERRAARKEGP